MNKNLLDNVVWDLIDRNADYKSVEDAMMALMRPFGVEVVSCVEIRSPSRNSNPFVGRLIGKRDGEWLTRYRKEELHKHDVALKTVSQSQEGFSWSHAETRVITPEEQRVFDIAREHWVSDGFLVPFFGPDGRIGFTGFYGDRICDDPVTRRLFNFAGLSFYRYAYSKALQEKAAESPEIELTDRQTQVLYWISKGKTDTEMAEIMNISPATVNRHVEMAKERICVRSRTEAVHYALIHNLISAS
ncbi:MAG: hypothetical protein CMK07_11445 [Ponticaulis sp.]|nr:hypothetical protein [Ponticaulis sp.]